MMVADMTRSLRVHLLPNLVEPAEFREGIAVVIDVLRATTNIAQALAAGAERVIPCCEIDEARQAALRLPAAEAVLGGERGGLKIEGFDLGNSPAEYSPRHVRGKSVVFTTTNGTRALARAREARRVVTAAFVNLAAVARWLVHQQGDIHILCAGTDGRVTLEDVLCAGSLADALSAGDSDREMAGDDSAILARNLSERHGTDYDSLMAVLRRSRGGRNLIELGLEADLIAAALRDTCDVVPELSRDPWQIQPASDPRPLGQCLNEPKG
jgi:2-phosphosulfolactate phosphatase